MRRHFLGFAVGSLALASSFLAARSVAAADIAAGKEKAEMCAGCHGENGISQMENVPSLAGQLDNEDIRDLGAYFASLTPAKGPTDNDPDLSEKGKQAAAGRGCASCHTDT